LEFQLCTTFIVNASVTNTLSFTGSGNYLMGGGQLYITQIA
jgi:hypothetical protein